VGLGGNVVIVGFVQRMKVISLVAVLCAAVAIPGAALAANPSTAASITLGISGCTVTMTWQWTAQPGRAKFWQVWLVNDSNTTELQFGGADMTRSQSSTTDGGTLQAGSTTTYRAKLLFRDHSNAILTTVLSSSVAADCAAAFV
jgi:hypothetical protein